MKKLIMMAERGSPQLLCMALLMLFFIATYAGMYFCSFELGDWDTELCRLSLALMPTIWLLLRLDCELGRHSPGALSPQLVNALLGRSMRPCGTSIGLSTGGFVSMLACGNPIPGWLIGGLLASIDYTLFAGAPPVHHIRFLRGSYSLSMRQATAKVLRMIQPGEWLLSWGGLPFPERFSKGHFFLIGATGSGKTVLVRLLMRWILNAITPGRNCRVVWFDAKRDALRTIAGMHVSCPVYNMNPFAEESWAWDMARDIHDPANAYETACILIPEEKGKGGNPYFVAAARDLCTGVLQALILTRPGDWTLSDLILILSSQERAERLLRSVPETTYFADEHYKRDPRTVDNVHSTLTAHFGPLRCIAALWATSENKISLKTWLDEESILVLGHDTARRTPLKVINTLILNRIMELILAQEDSKTRRTYLMLDEILSLRKLEMMPEFLDMARSKGARAVIGTVNIEGLHDVYGKEAGERIAAICSNKSILRPDSRQSAEWGSKLLGEAHVRQSSTSVTTSKNGTSTTVAEHDKTLEVVTPSQLMRLPQCTDERLEAYFTSPDIGVFGGPVYFSRALCPRSEGPQYKERPVEQQYLRLSQITGSGNTKNKIGLMDMPRMTRDYLMETYDEDDRQPDDGTES